MENVCYVYFSTIKKHTRLNIVGFNTIIHSSPVILTNKTTSVSMACKKDIGKNPHRKIYKI